MKRFFELAWDMPGVLHVRELESTLQLLISGGPVTDEQNLPLAIVSIGHDGTMSTFSPELLGSHHPRFNTFAFGHVAASRLADLERDPLFLLTSSEIRRGVEACKHSCRYFHWCGGGAPANKLFETGRFDATETMHCRLTRQAIIDEVIATVETRIRPPNTAEEMGLGHAT